MRTFSDGYEFTLNEETQTYPLFEDFDNDIIKAGMGEDAHLVVGAMIHGWIRGNTQMSTTSIAEAAGVSPERTLEIMNAVCDAGYMRGIKVVWVYE